MSEAVRDRGEAEAVARLLVSPVPLGSPVLDALPRRAPAGCRYSVVLRPQIAVRGIREQPGLYARLADALLHCYLADRRAHAACDPRIPEGDPNTGIYAPQGCAGTGRDGLGLPCAAPLLSPLIALTRLPDLLHPARRVVFGPGDLLCPPN